MFSIRFQLIKRLWRRSPLFFLAYLRRKATRKASELLPTEEWNKNWLGEEMRPFNSLH